jgi:hypothetical protein
MSRRWGLVDHVLNRANARLTICENEPDHAAFEQVLEQAEEAEKEAEKGSGVFFLDGCLFSWFFGRICGQKSCSNGGVGGD